MNIKKSNKIKNINFEDAISESWSGNSEVVEVPLRERVIWYFAIFLFVVGGVFVGRVLWLGGIEGNSYAARAEGNALKIEAEPAPRGIIYDRFGKPIVENKPSFTAIINLRSFLKDEELRRDTLTAIERIFAISREEAMRLIQSEIDRGVYDSIVLAREITQEQLIAVRTLDLPTISAQEGFQRTYADSMAFSHVVGFVGLPAKEDLEDSVRILSSDLIGKSGVELFYNDDLLGYPGTYTLVRDAHGDTTEEMGRNAPRVGNSLTLTVDKEFQEYLFKRLGSGLASLGRTSGVGIAIDPRNGEILALVSLPSFDAEILSSSGNKEKKQSMLQSSLKPLFNRAVSGLYTPGSTIKPLHGVAALSEKIIDSRKTIFSPGYLDVPNRYDPEHPTRFLDWRYQGDVDLSSALAQSSNVYFYSVGGGTEHMKGLGVTRLREWWERFGLGKLSGIDIPEEQAGFLPSPEWKEEKKGTPWLLGDTYNISIGQGDLLLTPLQLINYIAGIANDGRMYVPHVAKQNEPKIIYDVSFAKLEIEEVQRGMREAVTSPLGTAKTMNDLPFMVAGKTGSAQISNNTAENAFFVGFAPYENPEIAILILVERAREGSLNAVPIAKDALAWYYQNRIKNNINNN